MQKIVWQLLNMWHVTHNLLWHLNIKVQFFPYRDGQYLLDFYLLYIFVLTSVFELSQFEQFTPTTSNRYVLINLETTFSLIYAAKLKKTIDLKLNYKKELNENKSFFDSHLLHPPINGYLFLSAVFEFFREFFLF